jgi:hypothetical protein
LPERRIADQIFSLTHDLVLIEELPDCRKENGGANIISFSPIEWSVSAEG